MQMASDLDELRLRAAWCSEQSSKLLAQIEAIGGKSIAVRTDLREPGSGVILAELLTPPPINLRITLGTIVNEQRSILDGLACQLARRAGVNDVSKVYFPVSKDVQAFRKDGREKIKLLSASDRAKIESIEPWDGGHPVLFRLHKADLYRKHDSLLKWGCLGGVHPFGSGYIEALSAQSVIFESPGIVEQLCYFQGVTMQLRATFSLVYVEPPALHGLSVSSALSEFNHAIHEIIAVFD